MTEHLNPARIKRHLPFVVACLLSGLLSAERCAAQNGTLAEPFPAPAPNAALHYQRAMLHLARMDDDQTRLLSKPIWEVLPAPVDKQLPREVNSLLRRGRFAVRSAATGSRTAECNFGIDFATSQCTELLRSDVAGLHFYTMDLSRSTVEIVNRLRADELL